MKKNNLGLLLQVLRDPEGWFGCTSRYNDGHGCAGSSCDEILLGYGFKAVRYKKSYCLSGKYDDDHYEWYIIGGGIIAGIEYASNYHFVLNDFAASEAEKDSKWVEDLYC